MKRLNLGCGGFKKKGFFNVDINPLVKPDMIVDLNNIKEYKKFKNEEYDYVYISHVLEHLNDPFSVMKEIHRMLKKEGVVKIKVPHFSRALTHSQHKAGFDVGFPLYFNKTFEGGYYGIDFKLVRMKLRWMIQFNFKKKFAGKISIFILRILNEIINFFANLNPYFCSRIWCYYVGGFEEIEYLLKKK